MSGRSARMRSIACLPSPTAVTSTSSSANVSSMTRWIVTLSSAKRSLCAIHNQTSRMFLSAGGAHSLSVGHDGGAGSPFAKACSDEIDDLLHGGARAEHSGDSHGL